MKVIEALMFQKKKPARVIGKSHDMAMLTTWAISVDPLATTSATSEQTTLQHRHHGKLMDRRFRWRHPKSQSERTSVSWIMRRITDISQ